MPRKIPTKSAGRKWIRLFSILALLIIICGFLSLLWPWRQAIVDAKVREEFQNWMQSLGFAGWCIFIALQIIQIVIAIIPGEPFELLAGILYGPWMGLFSCMFGGLLGSAIVFFLVRRYGFPLVASFFPEEKIHNLPILNNPERLEQITLLLFLIPGTPKDILTYAAGLTDIPAKRFLLIATFARIPSIVTSVWAGASLRAGNWIISILLFTAAALIGLGGIWIHKKKFGKSQS